MIRFLMKGACALLASLVLAALPSQASALDPTHSGSWYDPTKSGHGFSLEIFSNTRAIMFWYTYDNAGEPLYLYADGVISGDSITFTGYYFAGMPFGTFDPAANVRQTWGTMSMTFLDCDTATFTYASTLTGTAHAPTGSGTINLKRLVGIKGSPCRRAGAGHWTGRHFDPTLNGGAGAWADLSGVLTPDGRLFFHSEQSGEVMVGTYTDDGNTLAFNYETCEEGTTNCFDAAGATTYGARDWIVGTATSAPYGTQPFELSYRTTFERDASLAGLAGAYSLLEEGVTYSLTVNAAGAVTGSDTQGCSYQGQLSVLDSESNVYGYEGTTSACTTDTMSGVVVNTDVVPGDGKVLQFRVITNQSSQAFALTR